MAPSALDGGALLLWQDEPDYLADRAVRTSLTPARLDTEVAAALAANDVDLARSFIELGREHGLQPDPGIAREFEASQSAAAGAMRQAASFTRGLITGEPDDVVGLAGTALGDLFVFGDIRDALREGSHLASGAAADELVLGLSCLGLAVTAGTYATLGFGTPARVGLSLVKVARKTGRIGSGLAEAVGRALREMIDAPALRRAMSSASLAEPAVAVRAAREAVKLDKGHRLFALASDVGRIQSRAGAKATFDALKVAEGPRDVARLARLAESKGGKLRAILKLAGRGAIALTLAAWSLASWTFSAAFALIGFCAALKGASERTTRRWLSWRKRRRLRRIGEEVA